MLNLERKYSKFQRRINKRHKSEKQKTYKKPIINGKRTRIKEYKCDRSYTCKYNGYSKCCQAALRRFNSDEVICCYVNSCFPQSCKECKLTNFKTI